MAYVQPKILCSNLNPMAKVFHPQQQQPIQQKPCALHGCNAGQVGQLQQSQLPTAPQVFWVPIAHGNPPPQQRLPYVLVYPNTSPAMTARSAPGAAHGAYYAPQQQQQQQMQQQLPQQLPSELPQLWQDQGGQVALPRSKRGHLQQQQQQQKQLPQPSAVPLSKRVACAAPHRTPVKLLVHDVNDLLRWEQLTMSTMLGLMGEKGHPINFAFIVSQLAVRLRCPEELIERLAPRVMYEACNKGYVRRVNGKFVLRFTYRRNSSKKSTKRGKKFRT